MKRVYDLYGSEIDDLESCRKLIQSALGIEFVGHESSYAGEYYRWGQPYGEELILQKNFDEEEQEYHKEKYKDAKILLYINKPSDPEKVRKQLAPYADRIRFLERKEVE